MLNVEIAELVRPMVDDVSFGRDGRVNFRNYFSTAAGEEPHDVAWSEWLILQENLKPHGLRAVDYWADNDTIGGVVENIPSEVSDG